MLERRTRLWFLLVLVLVALAFWGHERFQLNLAAWQAPLSGALGGSQGPSDAQTQLQLQRYRSLEMENERLRALLRFRESGSEKTIGARVAARDPNRWFSEFSIDRGSDDGLDEKHIAVTAEGVVGPIVSVGASTSKVRLLVDSQSVIPVMLSYSGATGLLYGRDGYTCAMKFVAREVDVKPGEWVLTSGLGEVYPVGLPVGQVVRVLGKAEALTQTLEVSPSARLSGLHEILVMRR